MLQRLAAGHRMLPGLGFLAPGAPQQPADATHGQCQQATQPIDPGGGKTLFLHLCQALAQLGGGGLLGLGLPDLGCGLALQLVQKRHGLPQVLGRGIQRLPQGGKFCTPGLVGGRDQQRLFTRQAQGQGCIQPQIQRLDDQARRCRGGRGTGASAMGAAGRAWRAMAWQQSCPAPGARAWMARRAGRRRGPQSPAPPRTRGGAARPASRRRWRAADGGSAKRVGRVTRPPRIAACTLQAGAARATHAIRCRAPDGRP